MKIKKIQHLRNVILKSLSFLGLHSLNVDFPAIRKWLYYSSRLVRFMGLGGVITIS